MSRERATLAELAADFAVDLTRTVRAVVGPGCPPFIAVTPSTPGATGTVVRQDPASGITLMAGDQPVLTLTVNYRCVWDGHNAYLAVESSRIAVFPRDAVSTEPLMRYEYMKDMGDRLPSAHLQVHGDHPALSGVMAAAGTGTTRGRRRGEKASGGKQPRLSELHFPLGGHRFRPCLEDILAVLMEEFGVTPAGDRQEALDALADGREEWRRNQVGASVRDAPDVAVRVLRELGYVISHPAEVEPAGQVHRLRAL